MSSRLLALCLPVLLAFAFCIHLQQPEFLGVQGFSVRKIDTQGIEGDVFIRIKNPNRFAFRVYPGEVDVSFSGVHLGKARLDKAVKIKAGGEGDYGFHVKSDFKEIRLNEILRLISAAGRQEEVVVKGEVKAGRFFYRKKFPVELREKISLR
jgi:LEA14-like dessication related protein